VRTRGEGIGRGDGTRAPKPARRSLGAAHPTALAALLTLALAAACEDTSYRDIGAAINVLTTRTDALVPPAITRLARFRRRALPQIEIALHTASPAGKTNLVHALEAIADAEAVPILRHFAIYDPDPEVRAAGGALLGRWSQQPAPLGPAAANALARITEARAHGEAPVVLGPPPAK
jgi:hypothetical protein